METMPGFVHFLKKFFKNREIYSIIAGELTVFPVWIDKRVKIV